ncbi:iron chelate uptake ABC transporter family permease subunit [Mangrovicoccus ximenensis]|uniref:iron chelate uptake ABC transporter family permease subunit n=1 Tax=Mangrovicoccus ximenensis TaxID=1911570 RepID=UPI001F48DCC8|nr:iron chelate uptake ABC transporter family permease subunit [Mangrovicoccus ximenensis]
MGLGPFLLLGTVALAAAAGIAVLVGEVRVTPGEVGATLANRLMGFDLQVDPIREGIVWHYRLSRAVVAMCAGASLAICGVVLQALLRNPLAEPYLLGISAGASTGAVLVIVLALGAGALTVPAGAVASSSRWSNGFTR